MSEASCHWLVEIVMVLSVFMFLIVYFWMAAPFLPVPRDLTTAFLLLIWGILIILVLFVLAGVFFYLFAAVLRLCGYRVCRGFTAEFCDETSPSNYYVNVASNTPAVTVVAPQLLNTV